MAVCPVCGLAACGLASHQQIAKAEVIRKHAGNLVLAERAEARLGELRKADPMTSYEQAVAVVLDEDPGLYQP